MKLKNAILITLTLHFLALFHCVPYNSFLKKHTYSNNQGEIKIKSIVASEENANKLQETIKKQSSKKIKSQSKNNTLNSDRTKSMDTSGNNNILAGYLTKVRNIIVKNKFKNRVAQKFNLKGSVRVAFSINEKAQIEAIEVLKSSKIPPLDESAIQTINNLENLPLIPVELAMKNIPVQLEIIYE